MNLKENYLTRRIKWYTSAIRFAWRDTSFKVWVILCTVGIVIGLSVGLGMTKLALLVAITLLGWGLEVANSSIEKLVELIEPTHSPEVKIIKDAFGVAPALAFSTFVICWLILVLPTLITKLGSLLATG